MLSVTASGQTFWPESAPPSPISEEAGLSHCSDVMHPHWRFVRVVPPALALCETWELAGRTDVGKPGVAWEVSGLKMHDIPREAADGAQHETVACQLPYAFQDMRHCSKAGAGYATRFLLCRREMGGWSALYYRQVKNRDKVAIRTSPQRLVIRPAVGSSTGGFRNQVASRQSKCHCTYDMIMPVR